MSLREEAIHPALGFGREVKAVSAAQTTTGLTQTVHL
jgi:hypothetical protein